MKTIQLSTIAPNPWAVATVCAQQGWRVFPLRTDTNRPAIAEWPQKATTHPDTIADWWGSTHINAPVGITTGKKSNLWVLDIDVKHVNGYNSLRLLADQHDTTTNSLETFTVRTPSGGAHLYFTWPSGDNITISNTAGHLGPGLDTRGWHGYVHAPHNGYMVAYDNEMALQAAPEWLINLTQRAGGKHAEQWNRHDIDWLAIKRRNGGALGQHYARAALHTLRKATAGNRNNVLNRVSFQLGQLANAGVIDQKQAWNEVRDACQANGLWDESTGGDGGEQCMKTFMSGWTAGLNSTGKHGDNSTSSSRHYEMTT